MKAFINKFIKAAAARLTGKLTVQLLIIFFCCTIASISFFNICMLFVRRAVDKHELKSEKMLLDGYNLSLAIQNENITSDDTDKIAILVNTILEDPAYEIILTDTEGHQVYPPEEHTDRMPAEDSKNTDAKLTVSADIGQYAVRLNDKVILLSIASHGNRGWVVRYYNNGLIPAAMALLSIIIFVLLFLLLTKKKIRYVAEIASGIRAISQGNLDYSIGIKGNDELARLADELNYMTCELNNYFLREKNREKAKSELMLSISHDLKSPLTAIIGYLTLLKDKEYDRDEAMNDYIERAYQKSLRLKGLLQSLLDYEGLSGEDIRLDKQQIVLNHLLEQLLSEYADILSQNKLRVIKDFADDDINADADPDYIIRVYENLLTNAIRYSIKPGEISLALKTSNEGPLFSISNKCEKIEQDELNRLFDIFYRLEKSRSEKTGGNGMGLAIAERITKLHGGKIWAEYMDGEITFLVLLPR